VNNSWFEIEQMALSRQHDLLQEAASLQRVETIRAARRAAFRRAVRRAGSRVTVTVAARLGGALVAVGKRLQGTPAFNGAAETCGVCGKHFPGLGPIPHA
jgi:hypothetical protein